jgi:3-phosphoshikimate 1-carboxyvinyltransferase
VSIPVAGSACRLEVEGGGPLTGTIRVPGDKSLSHRALLLAALAAGESRLRGLSDGDDVARTLGAVRDLGAEVEDADADGPRTAQRRAADRRAAQVHSATPTRTTRVRGGVARLHAAAGPIDLGNSGTSMRLLAGVVAGHPWRTELVGDASLSTRPMDRVAEPLGRMGASLHGRGERCRPPLVVNGAALEGIDYTVPMASAQVKSCVLLAGLAASGETVVRETVLTRLHTEELLRRCGAQLSEEGDASPGHPHVVRLRASTLEPLDLDIPGDPSQAAFWVVAACLVPGSRVTVEGVYVGPARRGFLDVLARMGAAVSEEPVHRAGDLAATADLTARPAPLVGTEVGAAEIPSLDEVPALAVAAAGAEGTTVFHDVGELRVKESDRLASVARLVRAFGAGAEVSGDDLVVEGAGHLSPGVVDAEGDHRIAMAAAVAGLAAGAGTTVVTGWEAVATSYPGFDAHGRALTARLAATSGAGT